MADTNSQAAGTADIGVIGLAVMGRNLARNLARNAFTVALYNRTTARTEDMVAAHGEEGSFVPSASLADFVASLRAPRTMILMVQAGRPTDGVIDELVPLLEAGDIIVDGGNAHYEDTRRRKKALPANAFPFVGVGVPGGEEGTLNGPSIMPGGSVESYATLGPILERIAATADGEPCCTHIGPDGAGHFVKMVHNGIEYADMQFIAEAYDILRSRGLAPARIGEIFAEWNRGDLDSYLIEITADVLGHVDAATGKPFVDVVADAAEQKGTGRWTVQTALELGVPVNTIAESVFARSVSGHGELRTAARQSLGAREMGASAEGTAEVPEATGTREATRTPESMTAEDVDDVRQALWAAKVIAYSQGMDQIRSTSQAYEWSINVADVAKIWRAGCIIRARLLERIRAEYAAQDLPTLVAAPGIADDLKASEPAWRRVIADAVSRGIPTPGFSAALAYYDTLRSTRLPAALVQGLRDYFGAHTYERVDAPGSFHTDWSGDRREAPAD